MNAKIIGMLTAGLILVTVFASVSINATPLSLQNNISTSVSSTGTISVVLTGRLLGMPGTRVRCQAIDGINNYDCTKTVKNSGTPIPYYLTCFVDIPIPGEYKLTADPVIRGYHGSSKTVYLYSPAVENVELHIGLGEGTGTFSSHLPILLKFSERTSYEHSFWALVQ